MQVQAMQTHSSRPRVTGALRVVESLLLRRGQQTARRNAWTAVLEDRRRAEDRRQVQYVVDSTAAVAHTRSVGGSERF